MEQRFIAASTADGVMTITLDRPDVLNSFNRQMAAELQATLGTAASDATVRAVLLTGAGRAFCAGQDLADVVPATGGPAADLGEIVRTCYNPIIRALRRLEKPVVCAVNGVAAGAGANLALACDIVVASDEATFIQSFCKVGLIPDSGGTFFLPRLIGLPRATALMMLGEKVTAAQALEMGMIWRTSPANVLLEVTTSMATHLAAQPTVGLGLIKRALLATYGSDLDAQLDLEVELQRRAGASADYAEGVSAFLQKRKPSFTGR